MNGSGGSNQASCPWAQRLHPLQHQGDALTHPDAHGAQGIAAFCSLQLVDGGQPVCLPATEGDEPLVMRLWSGNEPLYPSGFGTLAPIETAPVVEPDIVVAPLLAFDRRGTRLGYGKGHYDRTMALMRKQPQYIGLAFAAQELALIPSAPHDRPLDSIITELGIRHFAQAESV